MTDGVASSAEKEEPYQGCKSERDRGRVVWDGGVDCLGTRDDRKHDGRHRLASSDSPADRALNVSGTGHGQYTVFVTKLGGPGVADFSSNMGSTGSGAAGSSASWYGVSGHTGTANHN